LGASARRYAGTIHGFFTMPGILEVARDAMHEAAEFLKGHW
jgi:acetyl esterase/lipase